MLSKKYDFSLKLTYLITILFFKKTQISETYLLFCLYFRLNFQQIHTFFALFFIKHKKSTLFQDAFYNLQPTVLAFS